MFTISDTPLGNTQHYIRCHYTSDKVSDEMHNHTRTHMYARTHIHKRTQKYLHVGMDQTLQSNYLSVTFKMRYITTQKHRNAGKCLHIHTHRGTNVSPCIHIHTAAHISLCTHTHTTTHIFAHARTRTRVNTHIHTATHVSPSNLSVNVSGHVS